MEVVFWISLVLLFYAYIGYGLLLLLLQQFFRKRPLSVEEPPPVTVIVPAYNEEACIEQKVDNCFSLRYPAHLLSFIFITDGSADRTCSLLANFRGITHLHQPVRRGKTAALNRAMQHVATPFVVFTDANALLHPDSIQKMIRHYGNPVVGGVSGEKRIRSWDNSAVSTGEQFYWRYESMLKKANAAFYTVVGAAGELFSIRTALFEPLAENIILDDFVLSAGICLKGYRVVYEDEAWAAETPSENLREEQKRKVRISAGCFQALVLLKGLLNPFRNARLAFQYVSHRVLRWTVCPLLVPVLFVSNVLLCLQKQQTGYTYIFLLQCLFYTLAFAGWRLAEKKSVPRLLFIPYYFVFMNASLYLGFFRFVKGKQAVEWTKSVRKKTV